jgi:hypothetical protein
MTFSERIGKKDKPSIQIDSMDNALRTSLYNATRPFLLEGLKNLYSHEREPWKSRFNRMWADFFKLPLHKSHANFTGDKNSNAFIYDFFEKAEWYQVYDAIEFLVNLSNGSLSDSFNEILEKEVSGYRILNGLVVPISDSAQIDAIQSGLDSSNNLDLSVVNKHLATSLRLLSDRSSPDYRNSIKEAISAVESLTSILTNKKKPAIKDALREL